MTRYDAAASNASSGPPGIIVGTRTGTAYLTKAAVVGGHYVALFPQLAELAVFGALAAQEVTRIQDSTGGSWS